MSIVIDNELLLYICKGDSLVWRGLLTFPTFGRWTLTEEGKQKALELFQTITIYKDRTKVWMMNGIIHRKDGPAEECHDGFKCWYIMGSSYRSIDPVKGERWYFPTTDRTLKHREGSPAVILPGGTKKWYYFGILHRENGPKRFAPGWLR